MASTTDILAGRAVVELRLKPVEKWGKQLAQMSRRLQSAAMQMGSSAIIMATPFVAGAKVFANFSKQMAFVATMLDKPQQHMEEFTRDIRMMSVEFGESTETLSRGLYDILSAGFKAEKAIEMLRITTMAGKAGMTDTASATRAIIAVLSSYSLGAEHAQEVSDSLFMTVRKGVLTFGELAGHIGMVSSTAAAAGVTMDEMGAALAIITRGGVETSHAVVALNNVLKAFLSPTGASADFAKQLAAMGLGPITLEGIKDKGFLNIMKEIAALPPDLIARLFPSIRGMRGIMALKANLSNIDEIYKSWQNKASVTQDSLRNIIVTFGHLMDRVKQAGLLILSHIGEALTDSLTNVGEKVIRIATNFGELIKRNKSLIVWMAKLIVTLGKLAIVMLVVAKVGAIIAVVLALIGGGVAGLAKLTTGILAAMLAWNLLGSAMRSVKRELNEISELGKQEKSSIDSTTESVSGYSKALQKVRDIKKQIGDEIKASYILQKRLSTGEFPAADVWQPRSVRQEGMRIRQQLRIKGTLIDSLKKGLSMAESRLGVEKATTIAIEKQAAAMKAMSRIGNMGFFLGFQHTPVLAYSSGGNIQESQLSALEEIVANTGEFGDLNKSIKKIGESE